MRTVSLLFPNDSAKYDISYDAQSGMPTMRLTPRYKRSLKDINMWHKPFEVFVTIYMRKPENAEMFPQLMTYARNIWVMSEDGLNWHLYDERFRFKRAQFVEKPRWGAIRQDIYNRLLNDEYKCHSQGVLQEAQIQMGVNHCQ